MNIKTSLRFSLLPISILGLFACDLTDSQEAAGRTPETTSLAPRIVMANGASPKATQFVRLQVRVPGSDIVRDTVYPYGLRRGRVRGIPVGAQVEIGVAGFDSVVNDAGQPELVYRWAGSRNAVAQAVTSDMDSATVAATQPVVEATAPADVPVDLGALPTSLEVGGGQVVLPTAAELSLGSDKEYRYALDAGDEAKIVSVSAGSPKVPDDGKVPVTATSWVKVRVFVRDVATGFMLGTEGDSVLVRVPPPVPVFTGLVPGDSKATISWTPSSFGRVQVVYRQIPDTSWTSTSIAGDAGTVVLTGLRNGDALDVKLRTEWGPGEGRDTSAATVARSVVPGSSVPTTLGAGRWYGSFKDPDTSSIGWIGRTNWTLSGDGTFRAEFRGYAANWSTKTWDRYGTDTEGSYSLRSGRWAVQGDSLLLTGIACASVTDSSNEAYSDSSDRECRVGGGAYSYGIRNLGSGMFALTSPEGWADTVGLVPRPDPAWPYAVDATKPAIARDSGAGDTIMGTAGEVARIEFDVSDPGSGLDSLWISGRDYMPYPLWRSISMDWLMFEDTIPASGIKTVSVFARDGAGNVARKDFYLTAIEVETDTSTSRPALVWERKSAAADTVFVKSGTVPLKGKTELPLIQYLLDGSVVSTSTDTSGNVVVNVPAVTTLTRHILSGRDDSLNEVALDTIWTGLDAAGPVVTWVSPVNGSDTTLAAGTTSRTVNVTATDAGSGVASVKIGTKDLSRSGTSWTGTVDGLVPGVNTLTLVATDALGNSTNRTLTLKVKTDIPLLRDTVVLGAEGSPVGSFLSVGTAGVFTTLEAADFDSSTFRQNWTLVDVVFRSDSANGHSTQGHVYSPASTLTQVSSPNVSSFVKLTGSVPTGQAGLASAYAAGTPVDHIAVLANDKLVVKTSSGKYALLVIGSVSYADAYDGTCTVFLGR